jgi:uncharacterized membrane protein
MQTDDKRRSYYYRYTKKEKDSRTKSRAITTNWAIFFLAGAALSVLFFAFMLQDGFNNIVLSSIGIFSLLLVITGLIILVNNR